MRGRLRRRFTTRATLLLVASLIVAAMVSIWLMRHRGVPSPYPTAVPPAAERKAPAPPVGRPSEPGERTQMPDVSPAPAPKRAIPKDRARAQTRTSPRAEHAPPTAGEAMRATPDGVRTERPSPTAPGTVVPKSPELDVSAAPLPEVGAPALTLTPPPSPPPSRRFEKEWVALAGVLGRYEQAYDNLDAGAAASIWPSVDVRALTRAFARLNSQDLQLGDCTFAVSENDATAQCAGVLHYARRIGDTKPKTERHVWTIEFVRAGAAWQILRVTAQ
jgi:hypothetical protein